MTPRNAITKLNNTNYIQSKIQLFPAMTVMGQWTLWNAGN